MPSEVQQGQSLTLNGYQDSANETNVIVEKPATLLLLGLFGEVGSLVSELKKSSEMRRLTYDIGPQSLKNLATPYGI